MRHYEKPRMHQSSKSDQKFNSHLHLKLEIFNISEFSVPNERNTFRRDIQFAFIKTVFEWNRVAIGNVRAFAGLSRRAVRGFLLARKMNERVQAISVLTQHTYLYTKLFERTFTSTCMRIQRCELELQYLRGWKLLQRFMFDFSYGL